MSSNFTFIVWVSCSHCDVLASKLGYFRGSWDTEKPCRLRSQTLACACVWKCHRIKPCARWLMVSCVGESCRDMLNWSICEGCVCMCVWVGGEGGGQRRHYWLLSSFNPLLGAGKREIDTMLWRPDTLTYLRITFKATRPPPLHGDMHEGSVLSRGCFKGRIHAVLMDMALSPLMGVTKTSQCWDTRKQSDKLDHTKWLNVFMCGLINGVFSCGPWD